MDTNERREAPPTFGLLGGLGVGAAIHYYRALAAAHEDTRRPMRLVMAHASISRATEYASTGDRRGLAEYLASYLDRLQAAGATIGILPAVTPHLCIEELQAISPIPVIDLTNVVSNHVQERRLSRVALFGTRYVVESNMYGRLRGVEIARPRDPELAFIHDAYSRLAHSGETSTVDRERFIALADTLQRRDGVEAIILAGTDFALMFDAANTPFPHVDCARAHIAVILRAARESL